MHKTQTRTTRERNMHKTHQNASLRFNRHRNFQQLKTTNCLAASSSSSMTRWAQRHHDHRRQHRRGMCSSRRAPGEAKGKCSSTVADLVADSQDRSSVHAQCQPAGFEPKPATCVLVRFVRFAFAVRALCRNCHDRPATSGRQFSQLWSKGVFFGYSLHCQHGHKDILGGGIVSPLLCKKSCLFGKAKPMLPKECRRRLLEWERAGAEVTGSWSRSVHVSMGGPLLSDYALDS